MLAILQQFYQDAYTRLRKRVDPTVAIVFHDSFRPRPLDWKNFMQVPAFVNVILDTHLYQCFGKQDKLARRGNNSNFPLTAKESLTRCNAKNCPPIVGEWSLALPGSDMLDTITGCLCETRLRGHATSELRRNPWLVFLELQTRIPFRVELSI
jgi:hypothetical protein